MAFKKRRYSRAAPKTRKRYSAKRRTYKKRGSPRGQRITIVLQQQPTGMMPAGLTLGKKNYSPVRARI